MELRSTDDHHPLRRARADYPGALSYAPRLGLRVAMQATRTAVPCIDGMWQAYGRRMLHPGYRLILRWCDHLDFDDVLRIDHASITAAATDPERYMGEQRLVFGTGRLPALIVPVGLLNTTHRYMAECERECGRPAPPESPMFAEVFGEPVTRASLCNAIRRALILLRLASTIVVDDAGHLV
jgi:hypothetical protein